MARRETTMRILALGSSIDLSSSFSTVPYGGRETVRERQVRDRERGRVRDRISDSARDRVRDKERDSVIYRGRHRREKE